MNKWPGENERPSGKPKALFLVIPDIFYRESILAFFQMDPHWRMAVITECDALDPRDQPTGIATGSLST
ncbi:MAG: hypothetical protein WBO24_02870 [Nitrospirales bacterium]